MSLLEGPRRPPIWKLLSTAWETRCAAVSVLIGMKPPFAAITNKLRPRPIASTATPKCRRFNRQNTSSPI